MRIGIDIRSLMSPSRTGVGEYTFALLDALFALDKNNLYFLFYNSGKDVSAFIPRWQQENVRYVTGRWPNKLFNGAIKIFNRPKIKGMDVFFSPNLNFTALNKQTKHILTIHDLSFAIYPEFFSTKQRLWHKLVNPKKQCRRADVIITPSENTRRDVVDYYGVSPDKIKVIYPGLSAGSIVPAGAMEPNCKPAPQSAFGGTMEPANHPYILFLGTIEPRKNIIGLMEAFEKARPRLPADYSLVIAGAKGWNDKPIFTKAKQSDAREKIKFIGYVAPEDKPALYAACSAFVYPSFYEGFGFPALEAMAVGAPVITSNRSSLPEITEGAAYLVNPNNIDDIAKGLVSVLTDEKLKNLLKEKGKAQAAKFTWQKAAAEFLNICQKWG